jgi:hypothetical protein
MLSKSYGSELEFFAAGGEFVVEDSELVRWQWDCFEVLVLEGAVMGVGVFCGFCLGEEFESEGF